MSSNNDTHQHLYVQTLPKSILKKSPSPRYLDSFTTPNEYDAIEKTNSNLSSTETPLTNVPIMTSNEPSYRTASPLYSSLSTSEDEQQERIKIKVKKIPNRPAVATGTLSSSSDDDSTRKDKRSMVGRKPTANRSHKHHQKDMQLDEFMRKYQQQGGIYIPTKQNDVKEQLTTKMSSNNQGNNYHHSSSNNERDSRIERDATKNIRMNLLESINRLAASSKPLSSPLQLLFDLARLSQSDRRTKIDRLRQYTEEQMGISAFLTIYKLIKSSQISVDLRQKPFCYYASFIPHLCCLIMLESEQQRDRL